MLNFIRKGIEYEKRHTHKIIAISIFNCVQRSLRIHNYALIITH